MPKVSLAFFATGCAFVLFGMGMGMWMGATEQFTLSPVHAHINLIGWASMGLMGTFYALAGERAPRKLAWTNYALITIGVLVMAPSLATHAAGRRPLRAGADVSAAWLVSLGALTFFIADRDGLEALDQRRAARIGLAATMPAE